MALRGAREAPGKDVMRAESVLTVGPHVRGATSCRAPRRGVGPWPIPLTERWNAALAVEEAVLCDDSFADVLAGVQRLLRRRLRRGRTVPRLRDAHIELLRLVA